MAGRTPAKHRIWRDGGAIVQGCSQQNPTEVDRPGGSKPDVPLSPGLAVCQGFREDLGCWISGDHTPS